MLVKALLGFAVVLFLTYPAAVLTTVIEGQSVAAIYSPHLQTSLFSYFVIAIPTFWFLRSRLGRVQVNFDLTLMMIILLYSFLVFWNLGRADILGDDYDLAYQAYNLQDGILAARKAYVISFNTHPPLFMTIKHYWFTLLFPNGLDTIPAWGYRGMEGILGIATILAVYTITRNYLAAAILAVNNYMVFLGRVYLREMYLTFFITFSAFFFLRKKYLPAAFLVACGLLVKTSAIVVLPVYLGVLFWQREYRTVAKMFGLILLFFSPVIFYNAAAFWTTGYMDATFSKIFGLAHPFLTAGNPNPIGIIKILSDIYSWPVFFLFVLATILAIIRQQNLFFVLVLFSSLFYFLFGPLREYYLLFLTIPFAVITASQINWRVALPILGFSLWYVFSNQSSIRKIYEPVRGWPELVPKVAAIYWPGDCLEKGLGVNDLALRAYFQTDDSVKKALLGKGYPHYYKMCDEIALPNHKIKIYYQDSGLVSFQKI